MQISLDRLVLCIGASIVEDSGKIEYLDQSQGDRENNKGDADIPDHNFDGCVYLWNSGGAVSQHECGDNVCEPGNNGQTGKFLLSLFRLVLAGALIYWINDLLKKKGTPAGVVVGLTLITAGAVGNIIDCLFYGILFGESTYRTVAEFLPEAGGYAPFFFGKVVDMFYFPIIDTTFPEWMPLIGGNPFRFFAPVFNFADSCVTCGAIYLIFFQWRFFAKDERKPEKVK